MRTVLRTSTIVALVAVCLAVAQVRDAQAAFGPDHTWNPVTLPVQGLDLAAPLPDGRVLLRHNDDMPPAKDFVYDPATNALGPALAVSPKNADGSVFTPLQNGDVLLSGRVTSGPSSGLSVFEVATGQYSFKTQPQLAMVYHTATTLSDGRVLLAGGFNTALQPLSSAVIYNPVTDTLAGTGSMQHARGSAAAILLDDGRVLIAGGSTVPPGYIMPIPTLITEAEIWNPVGGGWSPAGTVPPHLVSALARMADGRVLMAGGFDIPTVGELNDAVIFDPDSDTWSPAADMPLPLMGQHHMTLPDGRVLVTGRTFETRMFLYDPGSDTWSHADSSVFNFVGDGLAQRPTGEGVLIAFGGPPYGVQLFGPDSDLDGYNDLREGQFGENAGSFCAIMRADLNGDGVVNSIDQGRYASQFFLVPKPARPDQNGDGVLNSLDQGKMAFKFNQNITACP